ncbi:MAG: DEAD/DEAH box helicase [Proteobacteria bacterium]|nr:MAG: DEAD/DEAH box helicase [Pseudomonadota bacterium]
MGTFRACFIGIDRYLDESARDLTGAVRDAKALHALFTDSIPGLNATLLTDGSATYSAIKEALKETLEFAGPDDTVIISFAGHGSPSHRLLAHDTRKSNFSKSSISMDEVGELFRESSAKYIICLLDCCFSGGAGARVFDEAPILRDTTDPYSGFNGRGRVLFAAAKADQPALEDSQARHGLFTKVLIDVLRSQEGSADLASISSLVMDRVRAESLRQGFEQVPVLTNLTEGGMKLPRLTAGESFRAAFPDLCGNRVDANVSHLTTLGLPEQLVSAWKSRYEELNDLQLKAVNDYRVLDGDSLVVVAPTSSGKTFVGEMAAARAIVEGRKAVFLLPYKALVSEKHDQFEELYGQELGMRVIRCTGDFSDDTGRFLYGKYDLALFTYEMFLGLAVSNPTCLSQIGLVVVDEAQFITNPTRGISVELILTSLIASRSKGICPQIVALSAVIGNINHFDAWLGCKALVTTERPVKLVEGVIDRTGAFEYLNDSGTSQLVQLVPRADIRQRGRKESAQDVIVPLAKKLLFEGKKAIIFRNQKGKAQGCAKYLAADLGLPEAKNTLAVLPTNDLSSASSALRQALAGGTAFHTANLNREERAVVEKAFREPDGEVHFLGATTTVAAGINTPASVVIIAEQEFLGPDGQPFTVAEYKNMAGRAGRLGLQEEGTSIIYADSSFQRQQLFRRYVQGAVEPITSSFVDSDLHTWVIRLLAQVRELPRHEVAALLASTYGGYLKNRSQPDWVEFMRAKVNTLVGEMLEHGLLELEMDSVALTPLGRVCGTSSLAYASSLRLINMLRAFSAEDLTPEILMALVQALPELDAIHVPVARGQGESWVIGTAIQRYGRQVVSLLERRVADMAAYTRRCKRACILSEWIDGVALEHIERTFTANAFVPVGPGEIRGIADGTRFHLRSAAQILRVVHPDGGATDEEFDSVFKRLELGISEDAVALTSLPVTLARDEYMALAGSGITSEVAFRAASRERIEALVGSQIGDRLLTALGMAMIDASNES